MNQGEMDQEWQRLESRIDKFVGKFLRNDFPAIEHKPRNFALLPLPQEHQNEEIKDVL
jgi:hypothetical protein